MRTAWSLFVAMLALCSQGQVSKKTSPDEFLLTVTLPSSEKPVEVSTKISLGKAFEVSEMRGERKITLKGTLTALKHNRYHLRLTIVSWVSEKVNSTLSVEPDLALGESWNVGVVSSFISHYTVLLTLAPDH
jgi:hypothetical protein